MASEAQQPTYPSRPVRIIVGFTPASSNDILARFVGTRLGERLGQQVIVENRPGANGIIGSDLTAKATPDGHTLMLVSTSHTMNAAVQSKLPFDAVASFAPVAMLGAGPLVLVAHPSFQASSPKALVDIAKAKPGTINYASAGTGGINHFAGALFSRTAGVEMTHVPYKGGAPALTDVIGGQVQIMFGSMPLTLRQVRAGKVKALGVTSPQRSPQLPEMPTIAEGGVPGYEFTAFYAILVPSRTPREIVTRLADTIGKTVASPEYRERIINAGMEPAANTPEQMLLLAKQDGTKIDQIVRVAGIKATD